MAKHETSHWIARQLLSKPDCYVCFSIDDEGTTDEGEFVDREFEFVTTIHYPGSEVMEILIKDKHAEMMDGNG